MSQTRLTQRFDPPDRLSTCCFNSCKPFAQCVCPEGPLYAPPSCVKASKPATLMCPGPPPVLPLALCCCSHPQARRESLALQRRHGLPTLPSRASPQLSDVAAKGTHLLAQQPLELLAGFPGPGEAGGPENRATHLAGESAPEPDGLPRDRWPLSPGRRLGRVEGIWVPPEAPSAPCRGLISCERPLAAPGVTAGASALFCPRGTSGLCCPSFDTRSPQCGEQSKPP